MRGISRSQTLRPRGVQLAPVRPPIDLSDYQSTPASIMTIGPVRQSSVVRVAKWYYTECGIVRGRGIMNALFGSFLRVRMDHGLQVRLFDPTEYNQKTLLFGDGFYDCESRELRLFESVLTPGMTVVDVGCNLGVYSLLAGKLVQPGGSVHAFEPSPSEYYHGLQNIRLNGLDNISLNQVALAESAGVRNLYIAPGGNHGINSLGNANCGTRICPVQCVKLDDYVQERNIQRLDIVKIDVEGAERLVLEGAVNTLTSLHPGLLLIEMNEEYSQALGTSTVESKRFLHRLGYNLFRVNGMAPSHAVSLTEPEVWANLAAIHNTGDQRLFRAVHSALDVSGG